MDFLTGIEKIDDTIEYGIFQVRNSLFMGVCILSLYLITISASPIWLFLFVVVVSLLAGLYFSGVMVYNTFALLGRLLNLSNRKFI